MNETVRVEQWARARKVMDMVRSEEIHSAETARAMRNFTGAVLAELQRRPAPPSSGLVEQQRWFRRVR